MRIESDSSSSPWGKHPNGMKREYTCSFDGCAKSYATQGALRKHARKQHPEWVRRLGDGRVNGTDAMNTTVAVEQDRCAEEVHQTTATPPSATNAFSSATAQASITEEQTVERKLDRREAKEIITNKRREYYPNGTLKAEIEESKQTTDQRESVSEETKELRSQVLHLQRERAIYELKVERTFHDRVKTAVAAQWASEKESAELRRAAQLEDCVAHQILEGRMKGAKPLDVFVLSKVVQRQREMIANLVDKAAASEWLAEHQTSFRLGTVPQVAQMANDLETIEDFAQELPLMANLGFSKEDLERLGIWPKPAAAAFEESTEETFETREPLAPPTHPSPIDHLEKEAWTDEVMDECLAATARKYTRPLDPTETEAKRIDPPHLLEITDQFIRTKVYYEPGDERKVIHNRRILALICCFKHPCGEAVMAQVDLHRLNSNRAHYSEQIRRFFSQHRPLRSHE